MTESSLSRPSSMESLISHVSSASVQSVPDKLPPTLTGPLVWQGDELKAEQYTLQLSNEDVEAIRAAVTMFAGKGLQASQLGTDAFPLPHQVARKLSALSEQIHSGVGVAVVRGLDNAELNDEESVIAFAGIATYVCSERATDPYANQTLTHIRDATYDIVPEWARDIGLAGSKLPVAMEFHADRFSGDVLALYVRNSGDQEDGGDQYLASFWAVYNELLQIAPDVLDTLAAEDWPFELKHLVSKEPYVELGPAIFFADGKIISQIVRAPLMGSPRIPRSSSMPKLSAEQLHALQFVEETARRLSMKLDHQDGDIQFINNLGVLHARSAYRATRPSVPSSRHLFRMFLRDPQRAWTKPMSYSSKFEDPFTRGRPQNLSAVDSDPWRKISGRTSHG